MQVDIKNLGTFKLVGVVVVTVVVLAMLATLMYLRRRKFERQVMLPQAVLPGMAKKNFSTAQRNDFLKDREEFDDVTEKLQKLRMEENLVLGNKIAAGGNRSSSFEESSFKNKTVREKLMERELENITNQMQGYDSRRSVILEKTKNAERLDRELQRVSEVIDTLDSWRPTKVRVVHHIGRK